MAGATGFIGRNLVRVLLEKGHKVRCLARSENSAEKCRARGIEPFAGDIGKPETLHGAMEGISIAVNLTGIIEEKGGQTFETVHIEGTKALAKEASKAGVGHFIQQSALGADMNSRARYHSTKAKGERAVADTGISHTIFRPSLVIGPGDGFTQKVSGIINSPSPVIPVPGSGKARFQPVYVEDLVRCFVSVITEPEKRGRTYELGGPEHLTYNEIVRSLAHALGVKKKLVHIPLGLASLGVKLLEHTPLRQATSEQLMLLNTDNICELDSVSRHFGFEPLKFNDALARFISLQGQDR